jgi:hypothetical protein
VVKRLSLLLWQSVVLLWTIFTVVTFAVITVLILRVPQFPLGITFVSTRGIAGLWITIPAFVLGIAGLILMLFRHISGARCLLLYSAFWTASASYGVFQRLNTVIHQPLHVCLTGTCATFPVTLAILAAFVLCVIWFWRKSCARVA